MFGKRVLVNAAGVATLAVSLLAPAQAVLLVNLFEDGADVRVSYTGDLDIAGLSPVSTTSPALPTGIAPNSALFGNVSGDSLAVYDGIAAPNFGGGGLNVGNYLFGESFLVEGSNLALPIGFAGGALSGAGIFTGESLATLGVVLGIYVTALPNDQVVLNVGAAPSPAAVPAPAAAALVAVGLLGWMRVRPNRA